MRPRKYREFRDGCGRGGISLHRGMRKDQGMAHKEAGEDSIGCEHVDTREKGFLGEELGRKPVWGLGGRGESEGMKLQG